MAAEYVQRIGARIAARRSEMGLSQVDIARALPGKVDGSQVSRWERGLHRPGDDTLERLGEILDVPVSYFMAAEPVKDDTPDPFPAADRDVTARLNDVETKLDGLSDALANAITERDSQADEVRALLKEQSELLDMIRTVVAGLGVPSETTLQDHLVQLVRDTAVKDAAALQQRRKKS